MLTLSNFVRKYCGAGYRIVSTGDLTEMQIAEARQDSRFYVNNEGFGFVALPWELTTDKDEERFRNKLKHHCKVPVDTEFYIPLLEQVLDIIDCFWDEPSITIGTDNENVLNDLKATIESLKQGKSRPPVNLG